MLSINLFKSSVRVCTQRPQPGTQSPHLAFYPSTSRPHNALSERGLGVLPEKMGCEASSQHYECSNPRPNVGRIRAITDARDADRILSMLTGDSPTDVCIEAVSAIWDIETNSKYERACMLDFCFRHGCLGNVTNLRRYLPSQFDGKRTDRCGNCEDLGHISRYCPRANLAPR